MGFWEDLKKIKEPDDIFELLGFYGFIPGAIIGVIIGLMGAGIGGAIVGLLLGAVAGMFLMPLFACLAYWGLVWLFWLCIIGSIIWVISSLWNVGKP